MKQEQNKKYLLAFYLSVGVNALFIIGFLVFIFTSFFDYVLLEKSLMSICPLVKERDAVVYEKAFRVVCEDASVWAPATPPMSR
jgi:hypothetical protein